MWQMCIEYMKAFWFVLDNIGLTSQDKHLLNIYNFTLKSKITYTQLSSSINLSVNIDTRKYRAQKVVF